MSANTATGTFVSFPEVKEWKIEYGIILRSYKIRVNLASASSDHVSFTPTFSHSGNSIISSVRQSVELTCYLGPHWCTFFAQMEKENPLVIDDPQSVSSQQNEVCVLYLNLKELPDDVFLLIKHSANVVCGCNKESSKKASKSKDKFIDCENQPMTILSSSSPLTLSRHQHDYTSHGLQQEYFISITVFDFSKATVIPFEAQRVLARKKCSLQLRNHVVNEWVKPFDLTIKCKGGYSIGAHKTILSVRSRVFKTILEADFQGTNIIHVMDLNAPVMKIILHFIYTGELDQEWMEVPVEEIIFGADKYELFELVGFFDHLMMSGCNFHNALRLAQLAERHSLMNARNCIMRFIEKNLGAVFKESITLIARRM